jgi:TRAP transporter TAXI family solute receptor
MRSKLIGLAVVLAALTACGEPSRSPSSDGSEGARQEILYTMGTGGVTGVYYPVGGAIARIVNRKKTESGMRLTVESTDGSVFNINAVLNGDLDLGVVQSDRQFQAVNGLAEWNEAGKQEELRSLFSIYPEWVVLCVAADSGIRSIRDLRGKRINIGNPGSGHRQNAIDVLRAVGIDYQRDLHGVELRAPEAPRMLQEGRIDGFFYTVGHPSAVFKEASSGLRKVRFIPVVMPGSFYREHPYYSPGIVPVHHYPDLGNEKDVPSFGVKATLVTSSRIPADHVYSLVKQVFENMEPLKKLHPALTDLNREEMLRGLTAPLHTGARRYFEEAGLL